MKNKIIFMAGSKEKFIIENYKRIIISLPKKQKYQLITVKNSDHKIDKNYRKSLFKAIEKSN